MGGSNLFSLSPVTCHLSSVTRQVSHFMCHLSHVTCHVITRTATATDPPLFNTMHCSLNKNTKKLIFFYSKKLSKTQNLKTSRDTAKLEYVLRAQVFNPTGSVVSAMLCKGKSAKNYFSFARNFTPSISKSFLI